MNILDKKVITHGVRNKSNISNAIDYCLEEIKIKGFTVIESKLKKPEINKIRKKIDQIYKLQISEIGGKNNLKKLKEENIARALSCYDDIFVKVATLEPIKKICEKLIGPVYTLISQNGIISRPKDFHSQHSWHRDMNYQHFTSSKPIAISMLLCVDKFSEKTGGTYVLRGSHRHEEFPSEKFVKKNQEVITANIGDLIIFDSMMFHRTGQNNSNSIRRCINQYYAPPIIKQTISFAKSLGNKKTFKKDVKMILGYGYENEPAYSAKLWRKNKIDKKKNYNSNLKSF
tara:strand:- start:62 stop:922 length:861 start_codon:yes stop_codon:yes gene_type:complete